MTIYTGTGEFRLSTLQDLQAPTADVIGAFVDDTMRTNPTESIARFARQNEAQYGVNTPEDFTNSELDLNIRQREKPQSKVIPEEYQKLWFEDAGVPLKPRPGLRQETMEILIEQKQEEMRIQSIMQRASGGQIALGMAAALGASLVDPVNVVSGFIPVVGPTRYAAALARAGSSGGRAAVRFGLGAVEGAVGAAIVEPIVYGQAQNEQADYRLADSLLNVVFGGVMGGGLHAGIGKISDMRQSKVDVTQRSAMAEAFDSLPIEVKEDLFRSNMALALQDRDPIISFQNLSTYEYKPPRAATALDQVWQEGPIRVKVDVGTQEVKIDGEVIPPDIAAIAKQQDPALWAKYEDLNTRITSYREWLDGMRKGDAVEKAKQEVASLDTEIEATKAKIAKSNSKNAKKLMPKLTELTAKREALFADVSAKDTAGMAEIRQKVVEIDQQMRDMAVEVTDSTNRAREAAAGMPVKKAEGQTEVKYKVNDVYMDSKSLVESQSDRNLRFYDQEALDDVDATPVEDIGKVEDIDAVEAEINQQTLDIMAEYERLGLEHPDLESVDPATQMAEAQSVADQALAVCQFGRAI
jgi:hypothetical protein